MAQNDLMNQLKNMDKKDRKALLDRLTEALTPEQQSQLKGILQDKRQMDKVQNNLKPNDLQSLLNGLLGAEKPQDFLNSPQVQSRIKDLLN